jgi:hypothetical protein
MQPSRSMRHKTQKTSARSHLRRLRRECPSQLLAALSETLLVPFRRRSGETRRSDFDRLMRGGMKQLLRGHTSPGQPLLLMMAKEVVQRLLIRG